ncbi:MULTISPECIES: hypothetical protein [Actinomadura]|uniref:Uncharacterized protein n=1 Tax=Actinomadura yumaensis TaxID=111807 RepID=A0ABW2D133_9ACTN|nr:hypothetical protein [Actinomadura sp. J1-007]MWK36401.1 hypothetical protein [Actinomadura sp. J1-007]
MVLLLALAASAAMTAPAPPAAPAAVPARPASARPAFAVPAAGLTATVGGVRCPRRQVAVNVVNGTDAPHTYELRSNGRVVRRERVPADQTTQRLATLRERRRTTITVTSEGRTIARASRKADCAGHAPDGDAAALPVPALGDGEDLSGAEQGTGGAHRGKSARLPRTGEGGGTTVRVITALAVLAGGGVLVFWGLLWPGRGRGDWATPSRRRTP